DIHVCHVMQRHPPTPTLFPYTTLFRSGSRSHGSATCSVWAVRPRSCCSSASTPTGSPGASATSASCDDVEHCRHECRRSSRTARSEEHTSELQSPCNLVCRLLLEKKNK